MPVCNSEEPVSAREKLLQKQKQAWSTQGRTFSPGTSSCSQAPCQAGCHLSQALSSNSSCLWNSQHVPPRSKQPLCLPTRTLLAVQGVLTGLPGDEL
ncbi:hypothetical protein Nmel_006588, partial [Mimus melanotis]